MDVFKATPYRKRKENNQDQTVFQATKYRALNPDALKKRQSSRAQAAGILNDYETRIGNGEWLDDENRKTYRAAIDSFVESTNLLRETEKIFGESYSDEDEQTWADAVASMNKRYDDVTDIFSKFSNATEYGNWFDKNKKAHEYQATLSAEDFEEFSQKGASVENPSWNKAHAPLEIGGWTPFGDGEDIRNMVTFAEANKHQGVASSAQAMRGGSSSEYGEIISLINEHMTDDEKRIYNYYVGKGDAAKAGEYLDYMTDVLRQRAGGRISEQVDDTVWETLTSFVAGTESGIKGIDHFVSGVVGGKEDLGPSALQYAHGTSSENNKGAWKVTNDLLYTTGNMTPSLTAGAFATAIGGPGAGKIVGSALTGLSSSGNAYAQMIEKGYGADQARKYGILTGSAEAGLSYLISGISKLGGKLTGKAIEKAIEKIDSGIARFFVDFTINSASEAVEEGAQSVLEPLFKMLATGEDFEGVDWSEVAYSSLLGALSAGLLEGVPNGVRDIHQNYRTSVDAGGLSITGATGAFFKGYEGSKGFKGVSKAYREGQQNVNESAGYFSSEGLMIDPESAQAKRMQARLSKGKNVSGYQINRMIEANEGTLVSQDKTKIKAAVEKRLTELGVETGNVANIADVIVKKVAGERLTRAEQSIFEKDFTAQTVLFELSENFLNNEYYREDADAERYWAEHIGTERINADLYSRMLAEMGEDDADQTAETPVVENSEETVNPIEETSEGFVDQTADEADIDEEPEEVLTLEEAKTKYGSQAEAFLRTYTEGQNVKQYDRAYQMAYDMGKSGVSFPYVMKSSATTYLTEKQRQLAYEAGQSAAAAIASERYAGIKAASNGKKGRKKGTVKGENVTIADLKTTFNDTQNTAYKILCTFAEATGIDIVLYQSEANENGKFEEAQGKFSRKTDKIRIDINAGLTNVKDVKDLAKYTMLRTFSHEFTHFLEKWNPEWYNEFRKTVFDTITSRGEDVTDLIEKKQDQSQVHYYDEKIGDFVTDEMPYDDASREVIAEAMTDILPDSQFIETLVNKHKNIFEKLYEMLKEFLADLKAYFKTIVHNPSREAKALKEQIDGAVRYVENIVRMFDEGAAGAVENYQMTVAFDEDTVIVEENPATNEDIPDTEEVIPDTHEDNPLGLTDEEQSAIMAYQETLSVNHGGQQTKSSESDQTEVQRLSEQNRRDAEMQPVSERDSEGDTEKSESVHGVHKEVSTSSGELIIKPKETVSKQGEPSIEEREKAFKRKFAFLKKAGQVGVLHYGNVSLLTDSSLSIMATADEINFAHIEYSGTITERDIKGTPLEKTIDHANTQITEAPLQGVSDGMDVLVFNVDGKHAVFNKKLFSKLDGNILYIGDFGKGGYILKAVDLDGNVAGFLLSMKIKGEITDAEPSKLKSFSKKFLEQIKKQEEKTDVTENVDHQGTVLQPDSDRQGDSRVLEEFQAEDVSGNAQRGDVVGDSVERGQETRRDGDRADLGAGSRSESGDGDRQSGDLRRDDDVTPKEATEKLREEVTAQIKQQSTETPKGKNFVIGDSLDLPKGDKAKCSANIDAIKLLKKLEAEGRYATEAEQIILSKYVGWGGLSNAFDESKEDWRKEYNELKGVLTDEEYRAARASTRSAFFTDISVVKAMYDGLAKLGFRGGRMIEPSAGTGNFVGAMPAEMSANVKSWTMIELDNITGLISKYLYPNADVRIQGFEKANIPNNYMDVAIGNVPFGNDAIYDKAYPKKVTSAIHNYFFAKSLDKVRPGGIVMFITSSYTMDSKDETVRRYIMQKADLLGAIRLPNTAFKTNAGTDVVSDILILKKRAAGTSYAGEDFLSSPWDYPVKNHYSGAYVNSYFNAHPEMILGTPSMVSGRFGGNTLTYKAIEGKGSLADQIREAFSHIDGKMDYPAKLSPEKTNFAVERADKKTKQNGYVAKDGKIYQNHGGELVEQTVKPKVAERIAGMLEIRDAAKALMTAQQQGLKRSEIDRARNKLGALYDSFVRKNGYLNSPANKSAFNGDPDRYSLYALENWNPDKKTASKADIFFKDTIAPNRTVTSAKDVSEGLIVSINQTGGVDTALISGLTGRPEAEVQRELIDSGKVFKNRDGVLEPAESYLSGNVRAKLRDAEALVPFDSDYRKNVEALKAVMPADIPYQDIFVTPGTPWIPDSVYSDFAAHMLGGKNRANRPDIDVTRNAATGNFIIDLQNPRLKWGSQNTQKWGTPRRSFLDLFNAMLNSKSVVIRDTLDDGSSVVNRDATAAANEKIENIQKEFQSWLWQDEARRSELATLYNEVFNAIVTPHYNGENLTVNGLLAGASLRPHQKNAVQRIISSGGNTLLAHKVGAGKTLEMAAAAMKLKELGLVSKPMFVVPKALVGQWGKEFIDFFPTAKLLVAEASDFTPANRKIFMNRVANGNYDAVIVSYEQFEKIPISDDFAKGLYQEQIDSIIAAIEEAKREKGGKSLSVKDLEKKRKSLQTKVDRLTDKAKDEDNIDFEGLGIDALFVDEAHNFKNLFYTTSMTNVAGLGNQDGSKRAFDLYTKVRYLQKLNGGRGIVFATATPVMNSMSEMYIMQQYLQPDLLNQLGLNTFDAWAKQFGEVVNGVEIKPSGQGYRVKQSFSRFKNMGELQLLFRNFADVLTNIPDLKIPKMKGGAVNVVVCEPGQFQQDYMKELERRADNIKNVDPSVDNMLKITSDGRKISYTQRMIDPSLPYEEGCKIYRCAENVIKEYTASQSVKGTQIIFCDMATPKGKSKTESAETDDSSVDMESAQLYEDLKARLIRDGIPANEIAFIHEADTDQKKKKLFADVNDGKVRVLIGSTGKMGVGMNAQKRIVAIHHLDAPWRPGDVEQRDGRAFRQKNINDEVTKYTYVTEGSFDTRLWDILDRKQSFINQIMNGEAVGREVEDTGDVTLSAAEVKALASGSPLILEQVQLDADIKKLESLYRAHGAAVRAATERLLDDRGKEDTLQHMISRGKRDVSSIQDTFSEGRFALVIGKYKFTDKKEAGAALMAEAMAKASEDQFVTIGRFAGFDIRVLKTKEGIKGTLSGIQSYPFNTYPNNTTYMIGKMISVVEGLPAQVSSWEATLAETRKDIAEQEKLIREPFAKQEELNEKRKRYNEVMAILNPKEEQAFSDDDDVQEQSRAYLSEEKAPVFYSYMSKVIDEIQTEKMGASSVVPYLKGKGVKAEEIKWSGIEAFLDGKKSVTKMELQEFAAGSQLQIEEENLTDTRWDRYKFHGGKNYRELVFRMPNALHTNQAMRAHWGEDAEGILVHARLQDFITSEGKKMLFVEEIQSDWHNEGAKQGYLEEKDAKKLEKLGEQLDEAFLRVEEYSSEVTGEEGNWESIEKTEKGAELIRKFHDAEQVYQSVLDASIEKVPDAPFRKNYHEYVLKRLIRMAAEEGYDSIGWTPAAEQSFRWSDEYAEGYRIEYDQDIPKFLRKYGKRWGATVGKTNIDVGHSTEAELEMAALGYIEIEPFYAEVWAMDITGAMKESVLYDGQAQYQQRTETLTDREILEMAATDIDVGVLTDAEKTALAIFQGRLSKLKDLQDERAEQGKLYKQQQFGPDPNRAEAEKTLNRMHVLDGQIQKAYADVLTVEEKEVLRRVLEKARTVIEKNQRAHDREILDRYRNRRDNAEAIRKYRKRLLKNVSELSDWILKPDNKEAIRRVPDALKSAVVPFLTSINFMSQRSLKGGDITQADEDLMKKLRKLRDSVRVTLAKGGMDVEDGMEADGKSEFKRLYTGYDDLPPAFLERLEGLIKSTEKLIEENRGVFVVNRMTVEEIRELMNTVANLKQYIMKFNRFHQNAMFQHVDEAGDESVEVLSEMTDAGKGNGAASKFLFWTHMRPALIFEKRFGEGGKSIYDELRRGQGKLAFNAREIVRFAEEAYTAREVREWEKTVKEFKIGDEVIRIPVSHIMSFAMLYQDEDGRRHIKGGGIRVAKQKGIDDNGHVLTQEIIDKILGSLTERQREVASKLQKYMAEQGGAWGNHVSVARFGEEMFTNPTYFPINSDGRILAAKSEERPETVSLYALLNMSFTKSRDKKARNRIMLYSIFDVFSNHMSAMAQYNAMALPVLDTLKWLNYRRESQDSEGRRIVEKSLREELARVYGVPNENDRAGSGKAGYAERFIINIIKAYSGTEAQGTPYDALGLKPLRRYNMAQVAYNLRVVIQQPLSITRAAHVLGTGSILMGAVNPLSIKKNVDEMRKYSGIAAWKALGFYDINISRGLAHTIKHDDTFFDKIGEVGMWGAETADTITWAAIWDACKRQTAKNKKLTAGTEAFYSAAAELFEDVIYKTQVVDSVLTKSEFMRDKGFWARASSSFMSEPVANASLLLDCIDQYHLDLKKGLDGKQAWKKHRKLFLRTVSVYCIGQILLAAVQSIPDALRDDDEYEDFGEKYVDALKRNLLEELVPLNKLPIVSDFWDLIKELLSVFGVNTYGNPPQTISMRWGDNLIKCAEIICDKTIGDGTKYTEYAAAQELLKFVTGITGLPLANVTREVVTFWNNTVGSMAPSLKVITYEATEAEIRNALYEAVISDDSEEIARIEKEYDDQKEIDAALRKALRDNDPRIREAAEAAVSGKGSLYTKLVGEIEGEGHFERRIIVGAIDAEISKIKEEKTNS